MELWRLNSRSKGPVCSLVFHCAPMFEGQYSIVEELPIPGVVTARVTAFQEEKVYPFSVVLFYLEDM